MFRGLSTLSLDAKGRMAMPSRYRERLMAQSDGQLVVTRDHRDPCLLLYPLPEWEDIERKLSRLGNLNPHARELQRILIGHATDCELDANGRILLPQNLRDVAKLEKHIALAGQGKKFEIWDEQEWYTRRENWVNSDGSNAISAELESLSL